MKRPFKLLLWLVVLAGAGVLLTWAFIEGREEMARERERETPVKVAPRVARTMGGETVVTLERNAQEAIGLGAKMLAATMLQPEAVAYGSLIPDPSHSFTLRAPLAGIVRRLDSRAWPNIGESLADHSEVGQIEPRFAPVERIDLMARLAAARGDVEAARASLEAARASLEGKKKANVEEQIVSARVLEEAEAKVNVEEARLKAAQETVRLIESSITAAQGPTGPIPLKVEHAGVVAEVLVEPGESVEAGQGLLRFIDFDSLLARVELPAGRQIDAAVSTARIAVAGHDDQPLTGERFGLGTTVNPQTQGQPFLLRVKPSGFALRPGAAVKAYLAIPGEPRQGVVIPYAAIVRYGGATWAYVQTADDKFVRREVRLDHPVAEGWFQETGFAPGERIVVSRAQTLLSEELKSTIEVGEEGPGG